MPNGKCRECALILELKIVLGYAGYTVRFMAFASPFISALSCIFIVMSVWMRVWDTAWFETAVLLELSVRAYLAAHHSISTLKNWDG